MNFSLIINLEYNIELFEVSHIKSKYLIKLEGGQKYDLSRQRTKF